MTKVFVSSKQGELDPERAVLHQALQSAEWDNFTIEFSGAFPDSVREVFLQHVAECDVYLGIFASIYSQPTVDEYHKARELGKPILIYLKRCAERQPELTKFILEEIQPAYKYQEFSTTEELVSHLPDIRRALDAEMQKHQRQAYLDALVAQTELLELAGIVDSGEQARPKLQEIFVALSAAEEVEERDERQPKDKRERERPIKITRRVTIEQALREHRNLMILGDPGAGKSTLLRYLTLVSALSLRATEGSEAIPKSQTEIASSHPSTPQQKDAAPLRMLLAMTDGALPILIRLSSFAQSKQSFVEYFESYSKTQLHVLLGEKFFERTLEDGQAIVCLDGLDEVSQPAQRFDVRNAITALANRYSRNRFIVTSRVAGYDNASLDKRAFAHHTIVPFGEKEIQAFAEKWYAAREREPEQAKTRAASLFNDLKANERLLKLAENPLTLTIIALVHQRAQGKLPEARVELYDRCAETLIEEWDKWKGLAPDDRARPYYQLRRRLLERAAYWMHIESQEQDVAQISKRALEMKVAEFLVEDKTLNLSEDTAHIEAKQFVALATSRTGILVEREQGAVSFIHLTFQEYFAASDLYWRYRRTPDALWRAIQPHLYDSRWLEVILLLLGRLNDDGDTPSIIVEKILHEHDKFDDVIHRDLFLAARCLADGVKVGESLQNEITDQLIELANERQPRYQSLRADAIQSLGMLGDEKRAKDCLLGLAKDASADPQVRQMAVEAIEKTSREYGVRLSVIPDSDELWVGAQTSNAMEQLGLLVEKGTSAGERIAAAHVLMALQGFGQADNVLTKFLPALAKDEKVEAWLRQFVDYALKQHELGHSDGLIGLVLSILVEDSELPYWVRYSGVLLLAKLGLSGDRVIEDVVFHDLSAWARKENVDPWIKGGAVIALSRLGRSDDAMIHSLLTLARDKTKDVWSRHAAIYALGQLGLTDDLVIHGLLVLARDEKVDADVRNGAAQALGQLGRPGDAARLLLTFARDEKADADVRSRATQALGQLVFSKKDPRFVLALLELAGGQQGDIQNQAYDALKEVVGNLRYVDVSRRTKSD